MVIDNCDWSVQIPHGHSYFAEHASVGMCPNDVSSRLQQNISTWSGQMTAAYVRSALRIDNCDAGPFHSTLF